MFIYCTCTQYMVGAPFALITASIQHGMEVVAIWKKSIPAFHFSPWAETNEEIEYKRELETEEERERKNKTNA